MTSSCGWNSWFTLVHLICTTGRVPTFDQEDPIVLEAIDMILRKATEHGVAAGIHNGTPEYALRMIEKGFRFVTIGSDSRLMALAAKGRSKMERICQKLLAPVLIKYVKTAGPCPLAWQDSRRRYAVAWSHEELTWRSFRSFFRHRITNWLQQADALIVRTAKLSPEMP